MSTESTRRRFLSRAGALAGSSLLASSALGRALGDDALSNPLRPKPAHRPGGAKAVIFLFMYGGPSQVDTFEYKPKLYALDGKTVEVKTRGRGGARNKGRVVGPQWKFKQYGQCGKWVSDLFPSVGPLVDKIAFVHSLWCDSPIHGSAMFQMNSGALFSGKPCLGSWVNYGIGSQNANLPGFVVMLDKTGGPISGAKNWSSGYMPATYQGTVVRPSGTPILDLDLPDGMSREELRGLLDRLWRQNLRHLEERPFDGDLASRVASYELAYRMMEHAPEAFDVEREPEETRTLYGLDDEKTRDFGRNCLLARRLVERGVRFVQVYSGGNHDDNNWDAHGDLKLNHERHAGATDRPIAGLLRDLERRGMLDETLVVWTGEFGRQPTAEYEKGTGRDHSSYGFTAWLAGGGARGGVSVGQTDELGSAAVSERDHVKDFHATILAALGFDPNALSFRYSGLDQRLVGVEGAEPIAPMLRALA